MTLLRSLTLLLALSLSQLSYAPTVGLVCFKTYHAVSGSTWKSENTRAILPRLAHIAYPEVPSVESLSLVSKPPVKIKRRGQALSSGLADPILEEARERRVFDDFKPLSDLEPVSLDPKSKSALVKRARAAGEQVAAELGEEGARKAFLKVYIEGAYGEAPGLTDAAEVAPPRWKLHSGNADLDAAFDFVDQSWAKLAQKSPDQKQGSLLPTPYPVLVAARGRFHESYYWDTYFMARALIRQGRLELAQMQAENFLEAIRVYGLVPNGMRDYYLSRSQPPFVSSLVREVVEASLAEAKTPAERKRIVDWLKRRALPLIQRDYQDFWMNPETRFDPKTGLNHHWDALNLPRPERHAFDQELAIGTTYRDTRAGAEGGRDFTETQGPDYASVAGVLLNSLLFKTENDLAYFAGLSGDKAAQTQFQQASQNRKQAMMKYLWNEERGQFENYKLEEGKTIPLLSADALSAPLFVNLLDATTEADKEKLGRLLKRFPVLEERGGIVASEVRDSTAQWDRGKENNAWAPDQVMAVQGLMNYGREQDARRIAQKWLDTLVAGHKKHGGLFERMDAVRQDRPASDEKKYPPQGGKTSGGFGWTNASLVEFTLLLGHPPLPR